MSDPVDLDAKRKAKVPKCEFCGGAGHESEAACPRVVAVTFEPDGGITYHLYVPDLTPDAA